ncbi:Mg-chelatase subunit ChlD [Spinactinospora alkalitolerans]|uniref:Mg-chelatase subunit ChlD n=1 Tax=Spinactinospora alkalitolerans TaxID=687207 RepID=A0A852TSP7_9ACTN|nr:DUF5682 family protein [Spinactinospora alkalitolerans]NYE46651.1 Mg-chelatase subunit ChlD [Spinactinospora alkalitolerans]
MNPQDGTPARAAAPGAAEMTEALVAAESPHLIGVRHHSPVLAAAMPALLDAARPDAVLVELPHEADPWLPWLGHPETTAPVALVLGEERAYGFYPFADFSPELAAIRWARSNGVPVRAIDLPASIRPPSERPALGPPESGPAAAVRGAEDVDGEEELWDRLVEARSYGADPERVRRAALAMGWLGRADEEARGGVAPRDLVREAWMRRRVDEVTAELGAHRPAAVVGAFHAAALLPSGGGGAEAFALPPTSEVPVPVPGGPVPGGTVTALIPYTFELLDSRSGYPAGIRDPEWQQDVHRSGGAPELVERAAASRLAAVGRRMRGDGHAVGVPDTAAAYRMARDLAALRGLAAPGRRELVEGMTSALTQGESFGRARAVAAAAHRELVGERRGAPASGAPASGLVVHVTALLAELGLPGPDSRGRERDLRLDPFRNGRDRARHVALNRLAAAGVSYAEERGVAGLGDAESLGRRWRAAWRPTTGATLEMAACYGITLESAARGRISADLREADGDLTPAAAGALLARAAECGLPEQVAELGGRIDSAVLPRVGLADAITLHDHVHRIVAGQVPGMRDVPASLPRLRTRLAEAAVASVAGMAGSTDLADAAALLRVVRLVQAQAALPGAVGPRRLLWQLRGLSAEGGPLAQGAATAALVLLDELPAADLADRLEGWLDLARPPGVLGSENGGDRGGSGGGAEGRGRRHEGHGGDGDGDAAGHDGRGLAHRIAGALTVAAPVVEGDPGVLDAMSGPIERWPDADFLARLPALREGYEVLSAAARSRFLETVSERHGHLSAHDLAVDAERSAAWAAADLAARSVVGALVPGLLERCGAAAPPGPGAPGPSAAREGSPVSADGGTANAIGPLDRWRLVLGRPPSEGAAATAHRAAAALDELYGRGHGEGAQTGEGGPRGGSERPRPSAREWAEELEALFGSRVREEVLGRAAQRGRGDVLDQLDPEHVTPSVDLLEHVLSLSGALPESRLAKLRPLVDRLIRQLVERLARRMRPALTGLNMPRPTRRPGGRLDLGRTIRANLHTARPGNDGAMVVVPERPVFSTRARRSADWHVNIVVDVSGSMERSTIYAALVAAVLHGLPALSVSFTAFSTEVVDLTDRVGDPLGLLLEVSVGGGTDIGAGLAHARARVTVPNRTVVALITDFEEGGNLSRTLGEVGALAGSGAHLLGLAALDDAGKPVYNRALAERFVAAGMPVAALSPEELASWIGERVRG